jgi:C4-dicarboxylate-specific signal transduction histidine kinase
VKGQNATQALLQREEALNQARNQLAHASRVSTLGEMTATIAHEVNQPLAAILTHGQAGLRWLDRDQPELGEVRRAVDAMQQNAPAAPVK